MARDNADATASLPARVQAAVMDADPGTGEVRADSRTVAALMERGLVVRFGATGRHYLTSTGRAQLTSLREPVAYAPAALPEGLFIADTGGSEAGTVPSPVNRAQDVATAWAGILEMRRLEGADNTPSAWERTQPVRAIAIALEAAAIQSTARDKGGHWVHAGYRVLTSPEGTRVEWRGPAASTARQDAERELNRCAATLAAAGWSSLQYLGRQGLRFLVVEPAG